MLYLVCRERNDSGDEYVNIPCAYPEKLFAGEAEAREYCRTAEREPNPEKGMGDTVGFTIYKIDHPASDAPELVARWDDLYEQGFVSTRS